MNKRREGIKNRVLGKKFELSLVVAGDSLLKKLNRKYRKRTAAPNVLSFPLSKNAGEIFLNAKRIRKEAKKLKIPYKKYADHIFIHSLLHLKGHEHGEKMAKQEEKILKWLETL